MPNAKPAWQTVTFGVEIFCRRRIGDVLFLVGMEPPALNGATTRRLEELLDAPRFPFRSLRCCAQVHSRVIVPLTVETESENTGAEKVGECDGLISAAPGLGLVVWGADCVPILLAAPGAAAAVHAGWRGAATGIVPEAVRRLSAEHGIQPGEIDVALGPAIDACHYPVGDEVIDALTAADVDPCHWKRDERVDLRSFLVAQLEGLGIPRPQIQKVGPCTACTPALASYRRDGAAAGRQLAISGVLRAP